MNLTDRPHSPAEASRDYRETEPDDYYWQRDLDAAVERGEACPVCKQRINPVRITALGIPLFQCLHCKNTWFDCTKDAK